MGWIIFILIIFIICTTAGMIYLFDKIIGIEQGLSEVKRALLKISGQIKLNNEDMEEINKMAKYALSNKGTTFTEVLHILREIIKVSSKKSS